MRRKVVGALASGLIFYALGDILLWQRIFEAHELWTFDGTYQTGHRAVLVGLVAVGMVLLYEARLWAVWYGLALYTLAGSGVEDVLYYWLDGRSIPAVLPWLESNPLIPFKPVTNTSLLLSSGVWIGLWVASLWVAPVARRWVTLRAARSRG